MKNSMIFIATSFVIVNKIVLRKAALDLFNLLVLGNGRNIVYM